MSKKVIKGPKFPGKAKKSPKSSRSIGDVTSITIPKQFKDVLTGQITPISDQILKEINLAIQNRELVHLIMTGINHIQQTKESREKYEFFRKRFIKESII